MPTEQEFVELENEIRLWRNWLLDKAANVASVAACYDCNLPYGDPGFADLIVPNDVWAKISPTGHEGGLLCPTCIVRRATKAGLQNVRAIFRSGPFSLNEGV